MIRRIFLRPETSNIDRMSLEASSHPPVAISKKGSLDWLGRLFFLKLEKRCYCPPLTNRSTGPALLDKGEESSSCTIQDLASDLQICIASFLTVEEAKSLSCACRIMHTLIQNESFLWVQWCLQQWPYLPRGAAFVDESTEVVINLMTPIANGPNYSKLLQGRAINYPSSMEDDGTCSRRELAPAFCALAPTKIQYTGSVGNGNRSIRSDEPMPQPLKYRRRLRKMFILCGGRENDQHRPFCSPFVDKMGRIQLTPRLVAYFEVTITTGAEESKPTECVAIGLSREAFQTNGSMPGWDDLSFGYHGDDGGFFHNGARMIRRSGPTFGVGDTVGCGVDYLRGGIFFTLNGKTLGYGWTQLKLDQPLYPTIGVDTNHVLETNFGANTFSFDLAHFCKDQRLRLRQQ